MSLLNLFKQCNEHYANTAQSDEAIERNAHQRSPLYKYYHTDKRNTAVQLLALSTLCNIKYTVLWKVFKALNFMNFQSVKTLNYSGEKLFFNMYKQTNSE